MMALRGWAANAGGEDPGIPSFMFQTSHFLKNTSDLRIADLALTFGPPSACPSLDPQVSFRSNAEVLAQRKSRVSEVERGCSFSVLLPFPDEGPAAAGHQGGMLPPGPPQPNGQSLALGRTWPGPAFIP